MSGYEINGSAVYSQRGQLTPSELLELHCSSCHKLLRDPMQVIACGHRFCSSCLLSHMNQGNGPFCCPVDNEPFERNEARKDRGCLKEISYLLVDCPTRPTACSWRGPLSQIDEHKEKCPKALVSCKLGCGLSLPNDELGLHISSQCPMRPATCQYCMRTVAKDELKAHYQSCEEIPTTCDYCNEHLSSRALMTKHLENECNEYQMNCPMKFHGGCNFQNKRPQMEEHLQQHSIEVTELLVTALHRIEKLESTVEQITVSKQESTAVFEKKISSLTSKLVKIEQENEENNKRIAELEKNIPSPQANKNKPQYSSPNIEVVQRDCPPCSSYREVPLSIATDFKMPQKPNSRLMPLEMTASSHRYSSMDAEVSVVRQELESHQTQLMKMSENLQTVQQSLTQYSIAIDEVRLRQDVLDVKTTNGVFYWKIPDIRRRLRDALNGRTISLYSPPFYTSPHGYRMCIRTYLNGDGTGKGTHISLFFVLMRSEHDNLLSWPFKQSVRFTLVNQKNPASSITEAFIPDLHSPSFQKPTKDMNVASGFPRFALQSILQDENYTEGNTIYIKCQVDLTGLSSQ